MTQRIEIPNFDPRGALTNNARAIGAPIQTGAVTYDVDYTDANNRGVYAIWVWVGTTGNVAYVKWDGTTEMLPNAAGGIWHLMPSIQILSSGTSVAAAQLRWGK